MVKKRVKGFNNTTPRGVFSHENNIYLFLDNNQGALSLDRSRDGTSFRTVHKQVKVSDRLGRKIKSETIAEIRISKIDRGYLTTLKVKQKDQWKIFSSISKNLSQIKARPVENILEAAAVVAGFKFNGKYVMYFGENSIGVAYSFDLKTWEIQNGKLLGPKLDFFGKSPLKVASVIKVEQGILLFYYVNKSRKAFTHYILCAVLFDGGDPTKILHKFAEPVWETSEGWASKKVLPVGVVREGDRLISYWYVFGEGMYSVFHPFIDIHAKRSQYIPSIIIRKLRENPIISPILKNFWESKATFNPAAVYEKNKVHIVYRAIGDDDVSVLGYASSFDGVNIDTRLDKPIYVPTQPFELGGVFLRSPSGLFTSGGGAWGGVEDPRITKFDDKMYMTYVAYNGATPPRVAITSIDVDNFVNHNWEWETPVLISKPGVVDKNACIIGEKVRDKYVIFHRIFPDILIDFVESLDFDGRTFLEGQYCIKPRKGFWDGRKIGVGPPPVKTNEGWLLIYQAVGDMDPGRYKIGAMLLSLSDPTRVLYRTNQPILEPDQWYENEGFKSGVAYPCGAVVLGEKLFVYYGGSDSFVCAATVDLDHLIKNLKKNKPSHLIPIRSKIN